MKFIFSKKYLNTKNIPLSVDGEANSIQRISSVISDTIQNRQLYEIDNDGIGVYEFQGHKGYDQGSDYIYASGSVSIDVTDILSHQEIPSRLQGQSETFPDNSPVEFNWFATLRDVTNVDGKHIAIYDLD